MKNKKWLVLIIFGLLLITIVPLIKNVGALCGDTQIMGYKSVFTGTTYSIENYMYGTENISVDSNFNQKSSFTHLSISVYLAVTSTSHRVKCCIYYATVNKMEQTVQKTVGVGTGWVTFDFSTIRANKYLEPGNYTIYVWAEATTGDCRIYTDTGLINNEYVFYQSISYMSSFPNPCSPSSYNGKKMSIYVTIKSFLGMIFKVPSLDYDIKDCIRGQWFTCGQSGIAKNMTGTVTLVGDLGYTSRYKFALYSWIADNNVGSLLGYTEERVKVHTVPAALISFNHLNFTNNPYLQKGTKYFLCVWGNTTGSKPFSNVQVACNTEPVGVSNNSFYYNLTYGVFPGIITGETSSFLRNYNIICNFTMEDKPIQYNHKPINNSVINGSSPMLNITISDNETACQSMNVYFYGNSTGTWSLIGSNLSVYNGTYRQRYTNASTYGTKYYWKVCLNDGMQIYNKSVWNNKTYCFSIKSNVSLYYLNITNEQPLNNSIINHYFDNDNFYISFDLNKSGITWYNISIFFDDIFLYNNNLSVNKSFSIDVYTTYKSMLRYDTTYIWNISVIDSTGTNTFKSFNFNTGNIIFASSLSFDNPQFFFVILIIVWLMIIFKYIDNRKNPSSSILAWFQFGICFPLTIFVFSIAYLQSQPFGYIIGFLIPIVSLYVLSDNIYYKKENKK